MPTTINYNTIVEYFHSLNTIEKQEVIALFEQCLMDERRNTIEKNHSIAIEEEKSQKLKFSSNIKTLKKMI